MNSLAQPEMIAEAHAALAPMVARMAGRPEVEGMVVLSSLARTGDRPTFDGWSDIDLTLWLTIPNAHDAWCGDQLTMRRLLAERLPNWLPNFSFYVPLSWGPVEFNVHQRVFEIDDDARTTWDDGMREAHLYTAEILFDRGGRIRELIGRKTVLTDVERNERLLKLAARLHWDVERVPVAMASRGEAAAAHLVVNAAVTELIEFLYLSNGRFPPALKWRLEGVRRYALMPDADLERLRSAIRTGDLGTVELERRVRELSGLWRGIAGSAIPPALEGSAAYRTYNATGSANRQLHRRTIADAASDAWSDDLGPDVFDLVNYLQPESFADLARITDLEIADLPAPWRELAGRLRRLAGRPNGTSSRSETR